MPKSPFAPLQQIFEECREWLAYPQHKTQYEEARAQLQAYLSSSSRLGSKEFFQLERLAHHSSVGACDAYGRQDFSALASNLNNAVGYRALVLRLEATFSAMTPKEAGGRPAAFKDGIKAAGPAMLSRWNEANVCAKAFVEIAEKDQRLRVPESRRLRHGTVDAFLIGLFSQAFLIETDFRSPTPVHQAYVALLQHWNAADTSEFRPAMQDAAEFHVSRSRESTDEETYEFDDYFTRVFPVELLTVQALRHRDMLPEIEIGHPLVDDTWTTITQLPTAPQDSLLLAVEARLKSEYPMFIQYSTNH
jgi:hypothetical protein